MVDCPLSFQLAAGPLHHLKAKADISYAPSILELDPVPRYCTEAAHVEMLMTSLRRPAMSLLMGG